MSPDSPVMRVVAVLLFILFPVFSVHRSVSVGATDPEQPFSMSIRAAKAAPKAGEGITIKVKFTNTSGRPLDLESTFVRGLNISLDYEIRDASGSPVKTFGGQPPEGRGTGRTLAPGESVEDNTRISDDYDLRTPGTYTIQLSRAVSNNPSDGVVRSNVITIVVTP